MTIDALVGYERIDPDLILHLIGLKSDHLVFDPNEMYRQFRVGFIPGSPLSPDEQGLPHRFMQGLRYMLKKDLGDRVVDFTPPDGANLERGVTYFFLGDQEEPTNKERWLPVDSLQSLSDIREIPLVAVIEKPSSFYEWDNQAYLVECVHAMARNMAPQLLWVGPDSWTFTTINLSQPTHSWSPDMFQASRSGLDLFRSDVINTVITKTFVQPNPPELGNFKLVKGAETIGERRRRPEVRDLIDNGYLLGNSGMYPSRMTLNDIEPYLRNRRDKALFLVYNDERNGMSWGYIVRFMPMQLEDLLRLDDLMQRLRSNGMNIVKGGRNEGYFIDNKMDAYLKIIMPRGEYIPEGQDGEYWLRVPGFSYYSSISGSDKTNLEAGDVLCRRVVRGEKLIDLLKGQSSLPRGVRPSWDTDVIDALGLGLAVFGSIMKHFMPDSYFVELLENYGVALGHIHGYPDPLYLPNGTVVDGEENIAVPCSAPHTAVYGFGAVEKAVMLSLVQGFPLEYIFHIEPSHGINVITESVERFGQMLNREGAYALNEQFLYILQGYIQAYGRVFLDPV